MSDEMPDGYVMHLPEPKPRPPTLHVFGEAIIVAAELSPSGFEQKEKTCKNCGAVRVTIFGSDGKSFRAWRRTFDGPQIATSLAPPCDSDAGWPR